MKRFFLSLLLVLVGCGPISTPPTATSTPRPKTPTQATDTQSLQAAAGQRLYYEGRPQPVALSFSGIVLTEAQLQQLYAAADTRNQIMITDDLGHTYWFYITNLQVSRQLKRYSEWYHTFSVDAIVLDWT